MTAYYVLRYREDTDLGRRFPAWTIATWATREDAEQVRLACPNAEKIEVVEVERIVNRDKGLSADSRYHRGTSKDGPERGVGTSGRGLDEHTYVRGSASRG